MRTIDQQTMNQLFETTDELGLDRESLQVPLVMEGNGEVRALGGDRFEIALPDADDLTPFLETLEERLRAAGFDG